MRGLLFLVGWGICTLAFSQSTLNWMWQNPIRKGLNPYGIKDCFLLREGKFLYLLGTDYPNPYRPQKGITLYRATDPGRWKAHRTLLPFEQIPRDAWYKDVWAAPEIHPINGKYYLCFQGRNNTLRPYKKTGFGLAVSEKVDGPYRVLTLEKPLFEANHGTLVQTDDGEVYALFDMDGRIYIASLDLEKGLVIKEPQELLGPQTLGNLYRYLDAPQLFKRNGKYHLLFSQFYAGYIVKTFHRIADQVTGPYQQVEKNPIYTWLEAEADEKVKMKYPSPNGFAPPTQVIFSNQIVELAPEKFAIVYHSSEKYSEPSLCIEPFVWKGDSIVLENPKGKLQKLKRP